MLASRQFCHARLGANESMGSCLSQRTRQSGQPASPSGPRQLGATNNGKFTPSKNQVLPLLLLTHMSMYTKWLFRDAPYSDFSRQSHCLPRRPSVQLSSGLHSQREASRCGRRCGARPPPVTSRPGETPGRVSGARHPPAARRGSLRPRAFSKTLPTHVVNLIL